MQRPGPAQHAAGQGEQRRGLGPRAERLARPAGGGVDHGAQRERDHEEGEQRDEVLALGHGEQPQRRGEEVVQQQEAADRRHQRRQQAAEQRDGHDEQQVEHEVGGERRVAGELLQQGGEERQAHDSASASPARRRPRLSALDRPPRSQSRSARLRRAVRSWVTRCTSRVPDSAVVVTPDAGGEQLRPPAAAAGTQDELGGVDARAKVSSASGTSLPTTWW